MSVPKRSGQRVVYYFAVEPDVETYQLVPVSAILIFKTALATINPLKCNPSLVQQAKIFQISHSRFLDLFCHGDSVFPTPCGIVFPYALDMQYNKLSISTKLLKL
jgi:hypothetical protein